MRSSIAAVAALTVASLPVLPGAALEAAVEPPLAPVLDPMCSEPAGQTDTPPHRRVRRGVVAGLDVAVVLPPGYQRSQRRYPVVYLLHGAQGDEDSWIEYGGLLEDTADRPPAERAIVVLPRLGVVTGIATDWVDETFRTRTDRDQRAVAGYSGGGLSAAHLAERFPGTFGQLGVFSGAVDLGDPAGQPVAWAMFEAEKLCAGDDPAAAGPLGNPATHAEAWAAADPVANTARLRRTAVWLSSGNGVPCDPTDAANLAYPTAATEPQMRQQADTFSAALTTAGIEHVNQRRGCGLHWWTTWRPALGDFWDLAAKRWRDSRR